MQYLRSVAINRFLDFTPGTRISFGETDNFLFGLTGTGKRVLLDLLAKLTYADVRGIQAIDQNANLEWTWSIVHPDKSQEVLSLGLTFSSATSSHNSSFTLKGEIFDRAGDLVLAFRFEAQGDTQIKRLDKETGLFVHEKRPKRGLGELLDWFAGLDDRNPRFEIQSTIYPVFSAETFDQIVQSSGRCFLSTSGAKILQVVGIPEELGKAIASSDGKFGRQEFLDFNSAISRALGAKSIEFIPRAPERDELDGASFWRSGFDVYVRWHDGSTHRQERMSKGQKLLVAQHWTFALAPNMPYFSDETVFGKRLSHSVGTPEYLSERQTFSVVRNPFLLGDLEGLREGSQAAFCYTGYSPNKRWSVRDLGSDFRIEEIKNLGS